MSSVVINLLPDARIKRLKEQRVRQLASTGMIAAVTVCGGLLLLGFIVIQGQNLRIGALTKSIASRQNQIAGTENVEDILTTQQHLASITGLYNQRVYLSTFFTILQTISPKELSIRSLALGDGNTITISGQANNYLTASRLARAMEVSGVSLDRSQDSGGQNDFSGVELSGLTSSGQGSAVSFTIKAVAHSRVTHGLK